jgi:sn-glycerol 3-phosphate transport system permease protein
MEHRAHFKTVWLGVLLVVPQLALVFTFFYWPAGAAMFWAFTLEQPWGGGNEFVGFENFANVFSDPFYWASVARSIVFAVAAAALGMGIALLLAMFCDRQLRGHGYYRTALVWPFAVAAPAAAVAFRYVFAPEAGVFSALNQIYPGLWNPAMNGTHAMIMIIVAYSWKYVAYNFIFFLAGLQAIPRSLVEAGAMDGAGVLRRMRDIQLPLLAPTFFFLLVINLTDSFVDSFGIVDITTEGGPAKATELMVYKIYFDGFKGLDYSGAAAQSLVLMLLVVGLTIVQFRYIERRVHYT